MFDSLMSMLQAEVSGAAAKGYVAEITRFHRIQVSPGFRAAAHYVADTVRGFGLDAKVLSYPADGKTTFWSMRSFLEWDCQEATLHLLDGEGKVGEKLADFREQKVSVIQRSAPADGDYEVIALDGGSDPADYEGVDVKGKLVLTGQRIDRIVELAVRQRGAAGVLFDGMMTAAPVRERIDLPDARQYTSFWHRGRETLSAFGFALTPRQGDALRERCKKAKADGKPVRVRAKVVSSLYAGQMENVEATLPGETDEEIILVAHLCHPQPSANDNASGAGALMEVARVLAACVRDGRLAKPKRTIRFLWVPEMTGTYAYLATREGDIPKMIAGLNLDMVGEDQEKCGSVLLLESPAASTSSFAPTMAQAIRDRILGGGKSHAGQGSFPLFRYADSPFSGGSDHYILSDPTVGVPTPMIIQWPDKFYHTTDDTIDKVSPVMMGHVSVMCAAYGYWLAAAGSREAEWLAHEMNARFKQRVMQRVQREMAGGKDGAADGKLKRDVDFLAARQSQSLTTVRRLAPIDVEPFQAECAAFAKAELKRAASFLGEEAVKPAALPSGEWEEKAGAVIPVRRYRGPLSMGDLLVKSDDREDMYQLAKGNPEFLWVGGTQALYWADGKRTLAEVADLLELETGHRAMETLFKYFEMLARLGAVELRPAK